MIPGTDAGPSTNDAGPVVTVDAGSIAGLDVGPVPDSGSVVRADAGAGSSSGSCGCRAGQSGSNSGAFAMIFTPTRPSATPPADPMSLKPSGAI